MSWKKKGLIFKPNGEFGWMMSHAQVPAIHVMPDCLRVFFSTRNSSGKSLTACMDLDLDNPSVIKKIYDKPVLGFGKPGTFDDDGVMPGYVVEHNNELWLYYSGWNQRGTVPYHNAMGLAVSRDHGLHFERKFEGPIMDRTMYEPYLAVTPSVLKEPHGWKMWYVSGTKWALIDDKYEPVYVIKYAHSEDGIHWMRPNHLCIPQQHENEAHAHPYVIKDNDGFHMWYSYRDSQDFRNGKGSYRMGYATSQDGCNWQRDDQRVGIDISDTGWDSKMICYPYIVNAKDKRYLFYNGNGFGQSGFGYAVWE